MKTYEELTINSRLNEKMKIRIANIVVCKDDKIIFVKSFFEVAKWIKFDLYDLTKLTDKQLSRNWRTICIYLTRSINKKLKYKNHFFYIYNNKWKRKLKIDKLLNEKE